MKFLRASPRSRENPSRMCVAALLEARSTSLSVQRVPLFKVDYLEKGASHENIPLHVFDSFSLGEPLTILRSKKESIWESYIVLQTLLSVTFIISQSSFNALVTCYQARRLVFFLSVRQMLGAYPKKFCFELIANKKNRI